MASNWCPRAQTLHFSKYVGAGNDFILVDNRSGEFPKENEDLIARICSRRLSVGADGLILLEPSELADFRMRIFNADGRETEMCGNGMRCLMRFLFDLGYRQPRYRIQTYDRLLFAEHRGERIAVGMGDVTEIHWDMNLELEDRCVRTHHLNTGVPHIVHFCEDPSDMDLAYWGPRLRHHPSLQPAGANANFVAVREGVVEARTYERGVEGETLACGTGACAVALAAAKEYGLRSPVAVRVASGDILTVEWVGSATDPEALVLVGPAYRVYTAEIPHWERLRKETPLARTELPLAEATV